MSISRINWGILGTGFISSTIANAIYKSETGTLSAVGAHTLYKAQKFVSKVQEENGGLDIIKCSGEYEEIIKDPSIDAIYIGLPNHMHKEWMLRALKAGKHVLCEKPFVISVEEAQEVIAVAEAQTEAKALFCMEALMYRCHPLTRKLVQLVNEKVVGDIKLITATYTASIEKKANPKEGGAIRNLGCYPVSLVRLLAGEPTEILGTGRVSETSGNDNQASVILKFANNVMAVVSTADDVEMTWKFNILGTEGSIDVISNPWKPEQGDNKIIITSHDSHEQSELIVSTDHPLYAYQIDVVGNYHLGNYPVDEMRISLADSLGNVRVVEEWRSQVIPHGLSLTLQSRENYKPLLMGGYFSASDAAERKTLVVAADEKLGDESDLQSRNVMGFGGGVA